MQGNQGNKALADTVKREWKQPELKRLEAGAAEANSVINSVQDGVGQQES